MRGTFTLKNKMKKYIVIENSLLDLLIKEVNDKIELGYVPLGGLILSETFKTHEWEMSKKTYVQSMILNK